MKLSRMNGDRFAVDTHLTIYLSEKIMITSLIFCLVQHFNRL